MKPLLLLVAIGISMAATAQESQVTDKCKTYLEEQARQGADLLRILAQPSAPDFSDSGWEECRLAMLNRIDVKQNWNRNIQRMKQMLEQQRREGKSRKAQCQAQGGSWRRTMNRCKMPNAASLRAQQEYERQRRDWEQERSRKAEEIRLRQQHASEP